ncbi:MAG: hypothetical protein HKM24_01415, partial [Gammaproteobacteria bacterium]|nr:hypothetical protein [Gammaproteobacteria bacterium]
MKAKEFFQENFVIIIGVSLPLLLVLFFVVARGLPDMRVPAPQYDLVFAKNYYHGGSNNRLGFSVDGGKLKVRYFPEKRNPNGYVTNQTVPELFYFDIDKKSVREINIELPVDKDSQLSEAVQYIDVPAVANLKLEPGDTAPDGYQFTYKSRNRGGLFGELMVGYSYRRGHV